MYSRAARANARWCGLTFRPRELHKFCELRSVGFAKGCGRARHFATGIAIVPGYAILHSALEFFDSLGRPFKARRAQRSCGLVLLSSRRRLRRISAHLRLAEQSSWLTTDVPQ